MRDWHTHSTESELLADILLEHSKGDARLFRTNAGVAWAGTIIERTARRLVLMDYHPVKLGPEGFSDLNGWVREGEHAIYCAIEGKIGRRQATPAQAAFLGLVLAHGGRAGIARTVDDAGRILRGA
jgi:hypothetical protein